MEERRFREYVGEALKHIVNNCAGQESRTLMTKGYAEVAPPVFKEYRTKEEVEKDNETLAADIVNNMKGVLGRLGGAAA